MKPTESIFCPIILVYQFDAEKINYLNTYFVCLLQEMKFKQHVLILNNTSQYLAQFHLTPNDFHWKYICENK